MIAIKKILCPVDFSDFSRPVLSHAVALGRYYGAEVAAFHVFARWAPPADLGSYPGWMTLVPEARAAIEAQLRELVAPFASTGVPVPLVTCEGDAATEIRRHAEETAADLIVMGTHGRSGFDRMALGSVAEKVLRKAACPVLTIPQVAAVPTGPARYHRILCPVDFSGESQRALDFAVSLSRHSGASLVIVHVLEGIDATQPAGRQSFALLDVAALFRIATEALHEWRERYPDHPMEELVLQGKPYQQILNAAGAREADLIAMGVRGRGAVDLTLFGSTTNQVVRRAACPVLTVRS